jgi:hypothetical protein
MPQYEDLERQAIPAADEVLQQLPIGLIFGFPQQLDSA